MSKAVCCLSIYATICKIIIIILSYVISAEISCSLITEVSGTDNKVKTSNNYEFLSFDNRKSKDGGEQCSSWSLAGFEMFEFLSMGTFAIFLMVKGLKKICGKGGYLEKRKETKLKRDLQSSRNSKVGLKTLWKRTKQMRKDMYQTTAKSL